MILLEQKVNKILVEKLSPKEFWGFIDETQERLETWVRENTADKNYECCGFASNVLYRILVDWKIHERCGMEDINDAIRISVLTIRGIRHEVVTILQECIVDPTSMQFTPPLEAKDYWDGWLYDDYDHDCEEIFKSEQILEVCRLIRPELYEIKGE